MLVISLCSAYEASASSCASPLCSFKIICNFAHSCCTWICICIAGRILVESNAGFRRERFPCSSLTFFVSSASGPPPWHTPAHTLPTGFRTNGLTHTGCVGFSIVEVLQGLSHGPIQGLSYGSIQGLSHGSIQGAAAIHVHQQLAVPKSTLSKTSITSTEVQGESSKN
jgi:hypothetical protein